jgi:hypothetical protein
MHGIGSAVKYGRGTIGELLNYARLAAGLLDQHDSSGHSLSSNKKQDIER